MRLTVIDRPRSTTRRQATVRWLLKHADACAQLAQALEGRGAMDQRHFDHLRVASLKLDDIRRYLPEAKHGTD